MSTIVALTLAYVFVAALLVFVLLHTNINSLSKTLLSLIAAGFYILTFKLWLSMSGWPASSGLPSNFNLISARIVEPSQKRNEPGQIYLWVDDTASDALTPRAYQLPYTREHHARVASALTQSQNGQPQRGHYNPDNPKGGTAGILSFDAIERRHLPPKD